jgi:hypothetical protein
MPGRGSSSIRPGAVSGRPGSRVFQPGRALGRFAPIRPGWQRPNSGSHHGPGRPPGHAPGVHPGHPGQRSSRQPVLGDGHRVRRHGPLYLVRPYQPAFPTGFKASADGATLTLSGTIEESGSFGLAFWVSDSSVPQRTAEVRVPINIPLSCPPLTFSSTVPSTAAAGAMVSAGGGVGTPTTPGTYTFSITATDAEKTPQSLSKSYTITVSG